MAPGYPPGLVWRSAGKDAKDIPAITPLFDPPDVDSVVVDRRLLSGGQG